MPLPCSCGIGRGLRECRPITRQNPERVAQGPVTVFLWVPGGAFKVEEIVACRGLDFKRSQGFSRFSRVVHMRTDVNRPDQTARPGVLLWTRCASCRPCWYLQIGP